VSPGRKGLGTPLRAFCAGFFTVLIFSRPGRVNSPTPRFLMWRSIMDDSSSMTAFTSLRVRPVTSAISATIWVLLYLVAMAVVLLAGVFTAAALAAGALRAAAGLAAVVLAAGALRAAGALVAVALVAVALAAGFLGAAMM